MKRKEVTIGALAVPLLLGVGLLLVVEAVGSASGARPSYLQPGQVVAQDPQPPGLDDVNASWTRTLEPVILTGSQLPEFLGAGVDSLFAYACTGDVWQPIPLQVDEVDDNGVYGPEDGLLDGDDELAFMAMDLGDQAEPEDWIPDADSQEYVRYEVLVTNPLAPAEQAWAYLYRSATLTPPATDYVDWDPEDDEIVGGTYVVGYELWDHPLIERLELNGTAVDTLDRAKLRLTGICWIGGNPYDFELTEENLPEDHFVAPTVDGSVRTGGGTVELSTWSYFSMYRADAAAAIDTGDPPDPCDELDIYTIRQSIDWLDPTDSGMAPAKYYDANEPAGVVIDGTPDSVPAAPVTGWRQVSGALGSVVNVVEITLDDGTVTNYYLDDEELDYDDTGDYRSYGDAGWHIDYPVGDLTVEMVTYILGPNQPNLGVTYRSYYDNPLETAPTEQSYIPPCEPVHDVDFAWEPMVPEMSEAVTFTAEALGTGPITFDWNLGDGMVGTGTVLTHTYAHAGVYTVVLTATNACGQEVVSHPVTVICEPAAGADFTWDPPQPAIGETVTFCGEAAGSEPITYTWEFGDGAAGEGETVTHAYPTTGTFMVILTATNACGQDVATDSLTVVCEPVTGVTFSWEPPVPEVGRVVTFTGEATGTELITYTWDFGDSSEGDGKEVTHVYAATGTYTVELTATNACGQASISETLQVVCFPVSNLEFAWTPITPTIGHPAVFTAHASATEPIEFEWEFGDDGSTATGNPVAHTFTLTGTFPVTVTAQNACGTAPPVAHLVEVQEPRPSHIHLPLVLKAYTPPVVPPCEELILNGSFEDDSAWYVPVTPRQGRYTAERAHSGSRSMLLGLKPSEADVYSWSSARQTIAVPDVPTVTLTFWFYPISDLDSGDYQECLILDKNDNVIDILMQTNVDTQAWTQTAYDLGDYAGETIKVYFNAHNDGDHHGVTGFYLDDVSVQACTTTPPPTPPPPTPPPPSCYPALWGRRRWARRRTASPWTAPAGGPTSPTTTATRCR